MYYPTGKRILDCAAIIAGLPLLLPLVLVTALAIKLFDPGPVFYRQERVGQNQRPFMLVKFRSMPVGTKVMTSDAATAVQITRIGKFIRRSNLDEIPQLLNILRGDMSLVGPRPSLPSQTDLVEARLTYGALTCPPGLTGLAQVNSYDGMPVAEKARFDGEYARSISLLGDVRIILRTFGYLLRPPPTY